jgi:dihydroorotate dehydrogenase electron transfer subunit
VRTAAFAAGIADFQDAEVDVELATDDGSAGFRGLVTDLLLQWLARHERPVRLIGCGPHAMLETLSRIAESRGIPCDVSIENQMACGFGACFSCVAPIRLPDGSVDLRRVCVEGPVFSSRAIAWGSEPLH